MVLLFMCLSSWPIVQNSSPQKRRAHKLRALLSATMHRAPHLLHRRMASTAAASLSRASVGSGRAMAAAAAGQSSGHRGRASERRRYRCSSSICPSLSVSVSCAASAGSRLFAPMRISAQGQQSAAHPAQNPTTGREAQTLSSSIRCSVSFSLCGVQLFDSLTAPQTLLCTARRFWLCVRGRMSS